MIRIEFKGDDALQAMAAIDTALTALSIEEFCGALRLSRGEIDHAMIILRSMRSDLLRGRAEFISKQLSPKEIENGS
jgi:hypothetical protein